MIKSTIKIVREMSQQSPTYLRRNDEERLHIELGQDLVPVATVAFLDLELAVQLHQGRSGDVDEAAKKFNDKCTSTIN